MRSYSEKVSFFVHPVPLSAVALMALNDHFLKRAYPSWFTGKLSDLAGVFFFPLLFVALWITVEHGLRMKSAQGITRTRLWIGALVTAAVMAGIKVFVPFRDLVESALLAVGVQSRITADPSDLVALGVLPITDLYARRFHRSRINDSTTVQLKTPSSSHV